MRKIALVGLFGLAIPLGILGLPMFAADAPDVSPEEIERLEEDGLVRLTIKVTEEDGKTPIDRANVRVVFKQGRRRATLAMTKVQHSWELKTTQDGIATIPPIPQGDILIQVTADWHQTFGETFTIEEPVHTVEVKLKDPQRQYSVYK